MAIVTLTTSCPDCCPTGCGGCPCTIETNTVIHVNMTGVTGFNFNPAAGFGILGPIPPNECCYLALFESFGGTNDPEAESSCNVPGLLCCKNGTWYFTLFLEWTGGAGDPTSCDVSQTLAATSVDCDNLFINGAVALTFGPFDLECPGVCGPIHVDEVTVSGSSFGLNKPVVQKAWKKIALPCIYEGTATVPPNEQPSNKTWFECEHPDKPIGPVVCKCSGCGPKCPGYTPDDPTNLS